MDIGNKVVIIGSPGAGKSTLAHNLHSVLNIKIIHLDRIFWGPGWKEKPRETRIDILQEIVQEKQWIIEGTYLGASEPRFNASDTIIFLDTPALLCLQRVVRRYMGQGRHRREIPEGCYDKLSLYRILKVMVFPFKGKRTLKQKLRFYESDSRNIIRLHSSKEIDAFLARLESQKNEINKLARKSSTSRNRQFALARR
jgi:adenylate kinase family enzyme